MVLFVDLNADLGEGVTDDAALLQVVSSANVACGFHAGDRATMAAVCEQAVELGVSIGAQVSYADREGFGRRRLDVAHETLRAQVAEQVGLLTELAEAAGGAVRYLKPHGALYHRVLEDDDQARAVLEGSGSLPVLGMPGAMADLAAAAGRTVLSEGFPDRGYGPDGRLLPRDRPGALVEGSRAVAAQAVVLAPDVDSLCVHGDSPGAVEAARAVRVALSREGWYLRGL